MTKMEGQILIKKIIQMKPLENKIFKPHFNILMPNQAKKENLEKKNRKFSAQKWRNQIVKGLLKLSKYFILLLFQLT